MRCGLALICIWLFSGTSVAQEADAYKFAPPPPPALEDYDEFDDEGFDTEDDGFRPPPPPIPGSPAGGPTPGFAQPAAPPAPPPDFRNTNSAYISAPGKFRFKIVEGEFWEKGKKRTRGQQIMGRSSQ